MEREKKSRGSTRKIFKMNDGIRWEDTRLLNKRRIEKRDDERESVKEGMEFREKIGRRERLISGKKMLEGNEK